MQFEGFYGGLSFWDYSKSSLLFRVPSQRSRAMLFSQLAAMTTKHYNEFAAPDRRIGFHPGEREHRRPRELLVKRGDSGWDV